MKFAPTKTLALGFGLLVVLYAVLSGIEHQVKAMKAEVVKNTRLGPRASGEEESASKRERLKRARKLSSVEAERLLETIIIPRVDFEDVTLEEAVEFLNAQIAAIIPESQPRPKIRIDTDFLILIKERRKPTSEFDFDLEAALGGADQPIGNGVYRIPELRKVNIPVCMALKEVCDATMSNFFIYRGDVYLNGEAVEFSCVQFYTEEKFDRVRFENVRLDRMGSEAQEIVSSYDFYGHKAGIRFAMSPKAREALLAGEVNLPSISLDLEQVPLVEVMEAICRRPDMHHAHHGIGEIIYDPLGEHDAYIADLNPFDISPSDGSPFTIPLDEYWKTWKPE